MEDVKYQIHNLHQDVKSLLKLMRKMYKLQQDPSGEKAKKRKANNGFNKLVPISKELAEFLGNMGSAPMESRSNVTRAVNKYITDNDLKNKENRRNIVMNETLEALLEPGERTVTFLNIQTFLKRHYI